VKAAALLRRSAVTAVVAACLTLTGCAAPAATWHASSAGPATSPPPTAPGGTSSPSPQPSAPVSSAPPTSAAPPAALPPGVLAGVAVFDRQTGTFTEQRDPTAQFRSASLSKLLIVLDYLWDRGPEYVVDAADRPRLDLMLRSSDDDAATEFWKRDGSGQVVNRMIARLDLQNTAPPPAANPGFWGYTALSAADVVRVYRYLLDRAPAPVREYVLGNLRQSTRCGTDGYDQSFGIPSTFPKPWAVKQGWSGFGDTPAKRCVANAAGAATRPAPASAVLARLPEARSYLVGEVLHTTGAVGADDRSIVVVLTQHPEGTSFATASATLSRLTRSLRLIG
jgi:hypothetical protein